MKINMNGEMHEILPSETLQSLLEKQLNDLRGLAVAVNNTVVAKSSWAKTNLSENDKILVITAAKGG